MSGLTKGKILEFLQGYPVYLLALTLAGVTAFLGFYLLAIFPPIGFALLYILQDRIPLTTFIPFIVGSAIPAAIVFYLILRKTRLRLSIPAVLFAYLAGSGIAILLLPLIAAPSVTRLDGFLIFLALACTVGYAFVYWRRIPQAPHNPKADT
ncbi:hypothetical protein SAMN05444141_107233 [Pseudovibrio denitrificans]|uniref:Uncharacterized protein n=1 Tax=Pseudovibrio denitrificans TaxID=258256 RepID=A0A1I7D363_9HYPH|nr:hypothetical protein [Pseudovibrio denitrificans]SFU06077.1 hypothetical protein SAMN05444141_107233 [Pseudovibrio denitrificans]